MQGARITSDIRLVIIYACIVGVAIGIVLYHDAIPFPLCPFKLATGLPCPGCGGIRAAAALLHGDILHALYINPLSCLLIVFCAVLPLLYGYSRFSGYPVLSKLLLTRYSTKINCVLLLLVLCNWIWNIVKEL